MKDNPHLNEKMNQRRREGLALEQDALKRKTPLEERLKQVEKINKQLEMQDRIRNVFFEIK